MGAAAAAITTGVSKRAAARSSYGPDYRAATRTRLDPHLSRAAVASDRLPDAAVDRLDRQRMRRVAHALYASNPLARAAVQRSIDLVHQDGPTWACAGGRDGSRAAERWRRRAQALLDDWADRLDERGCDSAGQMTLSQIGASLLVASQLDGDQLWLMLDSGHLQGVDGRRVTSPQGKPDAYDSIVDGVEIGPTGRHVAYWIAPWDRRAGFVLPARAERRSADGAIWWRSLADHAVGAVRGRPGLAVSADIYSRLEETNDAVAVAHLMSACAGLIIESAPGSSPEAFGAPAIGVEDPDAPAGQQPKEVTFAAGMVTELAPGRTAKSHQPAHPTQVYRDFVELQVQLATLEQCVPLFLVLLDAGRINLSSSRSLMTLCGRWGWRVRHELERRFYRPALRHRLAVAIRRGELDYIEGWDRLRIDWPPDPMMNAREELEALTVAVDNRYIGVGTAAKLVYGHWDVEGIARDEQRLAELGLARVAKPGAVAAPGASASASTAGESQAQTQAQIQPEPQPEPQPDQQENQP